MGGTLQARRATAGIFFCGLYLLSVAGFVWAPGGITERFVAIARGPYLAMVVFAQLHVLPGDLVVVDTSGRRTGASLLQELSLLEGPFTRVWLALR